MQTSDKDVASLWGRGIFHGESPNAKQFFIGLNWIRTQNFSRMRRGE